MTIDPLQFVGKSRPLGEEQRNINSANNLAALQRGLRETSMQGTNQLRNTQLAGDLTYKKDMHKGYLDKNIDPYAVNRSTLLEGLRKLNENKSMAETYLANSQAGNELGKVGVLPDKLPIGMPQTGQNYASSKAPKYRGVPTATSAAAASSKIDAEDKDETTIKDFVVQGKNGQPIAMGGGARTRTKVQRKTGQLKNSPLARNQAIQSIADVNARNTQLAKMIENHPKSQGRILIRVDTISPNEAVATYKDETTARIYY